jgi:hypothetical protein
VLLAITTTVTTAAPIDPSAHRRLVPLHLAFGPRPS